MGKELVDVDADMKVETEKAYGVSIGEVDPDTGKDVLIWLPKSQCQKNDDGSFTLPEWLAIDKGLV